MREIGITRRYVRALFGLALEQSVTHAKRVLSDLHWFQSLLAEDAELRSYLADPRVSTDNKKATLEKILVGDLQDLSRDFLLWVVERGRSNLLPYVAEEYEALLQDEQGIVVAEVTSASKLDAEVRSDLVETLEKVTNKKVKMVAQVDHDLLGGLRVRIGSALFDGSLRRQLEDMRHDLYRTSLPAPAALDLDLANEEPADGSAEDAASDATDS